MKNIHITSVFPFSSRYNPKLSREKRLLVWDRYWRCLKTFDICEDADIYRFFVRDVFQGGRVSCRGLSLIKGELRLSIDNTNAMNQIHELKGDKWACSHIERADFATKIVFSGVDFIDLRLGGTQRKRYYRFSEVARHGKQHQIVIYLTDSDDVDAYLWFSFKSVSIEDISFRMKKYGPIKI